MGVGLAGGYFVVRAVAVNRADVAAAAAGARPAWLVVGLLAAAAGMTGIGLAWRASLRVLGSDLDLISSMRGYFVGQLGKYVTGGVWAVMGRAEWARTAGVPAATAYSSVLLSMGSAYLAAVVLVAALVPLAGLREGADRRYLLVLLFLPLGFALIHPRVVRLTLRLLRGVFRRDLVVEIPSWGSTSRVVLRQVPSWVLIGGSSLAFAWGLGADGDAINVVVATAVAWIVGFIALPVPGGIGVREATFVALASTLPTGIAASVAVIARLAFITVDASGAALTTLILARRKE